MSRTARDARSGAELLRFSGHTDTVKALALSSDGARLVTGGDDTEMQRFGDWLDHDQRYARTHEFLDVVRGVWEGAFDYDGAHYRVADARVYARFLTVRLRTPRH